MNYPLISRLLGIVVVLLGASMIMSLAWVLPGLSMVDTFDGRSALGLVATMAICFALGGAMMRFGRKAKGDRLMRKEAMAIVALSWVLATVLGATPFWISDTSVGRDAQGEPIPMDVIDGLFESASGFSGTGATVITDLEDPDLVPPAILFWRSQTHFLGGLGIIVLFVAVLGLGSAGKTLMLTEMPGPPQDSPYSTSQHSARVFAAIFLSLTAVLTVLLVVQGMTLFDALCHAFATIATGGFSTHNASVAYFDDAGIEYTIMVFMVIACTNFTLLYFAALFRPGKLFRDIEFRVYIAILTLATISVAAFGLVHHDFTGVAPAFRYSVFQVVSMMTNTGFGTANFDQWCGFSRAMLLILMFIGGCAGSTSCSIKVIRHVFLFKLFRIEIERAYRPNVIRKMRLGEQQFGDEASHEVWVYFCLFAATAVIGWALLVTIEPDSTWEHTEFAHQKLLDCASAVAATINGVGPGLGIVGATENYHPFHPLSKLVLTALMLLGRLELFVLLVLFSPRFWRSQ